jgi:hypothetical protein
MFSIVRFWEGNVLFHEVYILFHEGYITGHTGNIPTNCASNLVHEAYMLNSAAVIFGCFQCFIVHLRYEAEVNYV